MLRMPYHIGFRHHGGWTCPQGKQVGDGWLVSGDMMVTIQGNRLTFQNRVFVGTSDEVGAHLILDSLRVGGMPIPEGHVVVVPHDPEHQGTRFRYQCFAIIPQSPEKAYEAITSAILTQPVSTQHQVLRRPSMNIRERMGNVVEACRSLSHLVLLARSIKEPGTVMGLWDGNLDGLIEPFESKGITTSALVKLGALCPYNLTTIVDDVVHYGWED